MRSTNICEALSERDRKVLIFRRRANSNERRFHRLRRGQRRNIFPQVLFREIETASRVLHPFFNLVRVVMSPLSSLISWRPEKKNCEFNVVHKQRIGGKSKEENGTKNRDRGQKKWSQVSIKHFFGPQKFPWRFPSVPLTLLALIYQFQLHTTRQSLASACLGLFSSPS